MKKLIKFSGLLALALAIMLTVAACGGGKDQRPSVKDAKYFSEGLLAAQSWENDKWGYIDNKGKEKIVFDYDNADGFFKGSALVSKANSSGSKSFLINNKGKAITPEYDECDTLSCGYSMDTAKAVYAFYNNGANGTNPEKIDFVDVKGKTIFTSELKNLKANAHTETYGSINYSWFDLRNVQNVLFTTNGKAETETGVKFGAIDMLSGKKLIEPAYDFIDSIEVEDKYSEGDLLLIGKDESAKTLYGLATLKGKVIVEPKYVDISNFYYGIAVAKKADKEYDFINTSGKVLFSKTDAEYNFGNFDEKGLCFFSSAPGGVDTKGYINRKGDVVLSAGNAATATSIVSVNHATDSDFIISSTSAAGVISYKVYDAKGKEIKVSVPSSTTDKKVSVWASDKYFVVEETSNPTTNSLSTATVYNNKGKQLVQKENVVNVKVSKHGFFSFGKTISGKPVYETVDTKGKVIIENGMISYEIDSYKDADFIAFSGYDAAGKNPKMGFMTSKGKIVVPAKFDYAYPPFGNAKLYAVYSSDGKYGFADKDGALKLSAVYSNAYYFIDGLARVSKEISVKGSKEDGYGFINDKGEEVVACKYQYIGY